MKAILLAFSMMAVAVPSLADEWGHYVNPRFGYAIDVPPGFVARGESANGDGQVFSTPTAELAVFGGYYVDGGFEEEVKFHQQIIAEGGWTITYQATTPSWASFSGIKGARIVYERMIAVCGEAVAAFVLTYSRTDLQRFDPIVERLVRSLKAAEGSAACPVD